jgi:predicted amidohydrolase
MKLFFFIVPFILITVVFSNPIPKEEKKVKKSKNTIRVAAAQILTKFDIQVNLAKIKVYIKKAKESNCRIVLFHEGCLTGYPGEKQLKNMDFKEVQKAENEIIGLAKKMKIAVLVGSTSKDKKKIYNDLLIINESGILLGRYAKTWRAGEPHYTAGPGPVIFTVAGVDATAIICHDLRYPELVRLPMTMGAKIVFIANNESGITFENKLLGYRSMQISRATENLAFAVMCNSPADPEGIKRSNQSHGNSKIVDPLGNVLDEAGVFEERLVTATMDLTQASLMPPQRIAGQDSGSYKKYGTIIENPAYTDWIKSGFKLVRKLDGKTCLR